MPHQTRLDARYLSKLAAARGQDRKHGDDGVMTPRYRFTSERAQRTSHKYGAHSVRLLALKPLAPSRHISDPNLGGGARVVQATREEGSTNTTMTLDVSK
jgi:hypothetical protein